MSIEFPRYDKRTAVIGSTGSGKTQFAVWLLSTRDFTSRPWVIFDFKGDALIEAINPQEINVYGAPPKKPGLYVVRPVPEMDDKAVDAFLWKCWANENMGIYIDEGYMIPPRSHSLKALLTQGRSKHIEMIVLSQRPVWMSRFVFSEANYFAVFNLTLEDDRKHIASFIGGKKISLLPRYHCQWYETDNQRGNILAPVPDRETLIETFSERLSPRRKVV